jgi:hypothetical protein
MCTLVLKFLNFNSHKVKSVGPSFQRGLRMLCTECDLKCVNMCIAVDKW